MVSSLRVAPPDFGRFVKLISTWDGRLCPTKNIGNWHPWIFSPSYQACFIRPCKVEDFFQICVAFSEYLNFIRQNSKLDLDMTFLIFVNIFQIRILIAKGFGLWLVLYLFTVHHTYLFAMKIFCENNGSNRIERAEARICYVCILLSSVSLH